MTERCSSLDRNGPTAETTMTRPSGNGWPWPYRFHPQFAVGSGVAVHADVDHNNPLRAKAIHTRTVPAYEIPATDVLSADTKINCFDRLGSSRFGPFG
jgi:hypothetical protein